MAISQREAICRLRVLVESICFSHKRVGMAEVRQLEALERDVAELQGVIARAIDDQMAYALMPKRDRSRGRNTA
jgi:hypothetical protein